MDANTILVIILAVVAFIGCVVIYGFCKPLSRRAEEEKKYLIITPMNESKNSRNIHVVV